MQSRALYLSLLLLVVPMILISCGMKPAPDNESEKQTLKQRKGVVVFQSPSSGSLEGKATQVLVPSNTDGSQTIVIGSASFYDWMEEVKKTLAKEKRENINQACIKLGKIGQDQREVLEIESKVDMECASVPQGGPSHTDPSPLDDTDEWIVCEASQTGPGSSGPGGNPAGGPGAGPGSGPGSGDAPIGPGGDSGGEPDGGDDQGSGSATVDSLQEILCTPAVGGQPDADPRLIYPAPDQVEAVVANLAPCIADFCPFEIVFEVPELKDPTDPIDPSQDEPEELTETIREQLMCDKFKGLCEPDITLISKGDLAKDKDETKCDEGTHKCDGVCTDKNGNTKAGEICSTGEVGSEDSEWTNCTHTEVAKGAVCIKHEKNNDGDSAYTVSYGRGVPGGVPSNQERIDRGKDAKEIADSYSSGKCSEVNPVPPTNNTTTYRTTCSNSP